MAVRFNWFGKKKAFRRGLQTDYLVSKDNRNPHESSEVMRVVNKFASIFMDGEVRIEEENGTIHKHKTDALNRLLGSDPMNRGKSSFLHQFCKTAIIEGGVIIHKTIIDNQIRALDLLRPEYVIPTLNTTVSRLQVMNYREFFRALQYEDHYTGSVTPLDPENCSFFVDNPDPEGEFNFRSRLYEIQDKINNSYYANNMLSSLLNRAAIVFLSRENKEEYTTISTTGDAKERTKNFNNAYHINNSAIVPIGDNIRAVNTTVNVRATGVFDAFDDSIAATCSMLGITKTIIDIEGATFANQSGAMKDAIENGIQSFANKVADFLTEMLKENDMLTVRQHVVIDYSSVLQRNLATTPEQIEDKPATAQAEPDNVEVDQSRETVEADPVTISQN